MKLGLLKRSFWRASKVPLSTLEAEPRLIAAPLRIVFQGKLVRLDLGKQCLWLFPEAATRLAPNAPIVDWILIDPDRFGADIGGFARVRPGETLMIGRDNENLGKIFGFPKSVGKRHLNLTNDGGEILLKQLDSDKESYVRGIDAPETLDLLKLNRLENLKSVHEIFGGPFEPLPPERAMATIERFLEVLRDDPYRPKDRAGMPGALIDLPDKLMPVVVGDLHAKIDNLLNILCAGGLLAGLRDGTVALILLGDTVHREDDDGLEEMESSLLMLDLVFQLKIRFPSNVFWLRGNHESFDETVGKAGVPQGQLLYRQAKRVRGEAYVQRLAECFDLLPYVLRTADFIACHAGPSRQRASLADLIDIRNHPNLAHELTWNRLRRPSRPAGYTKGDVKSFRKQLGVAKHTPLIVSHTPISRHDTIWTDVDDIKNHHIVFSAMPGKVAAVVRVGHEMIPLEYPVEPLSRLKVDLALAS